MVNYYTDDPIFSYESVEHPDLPAAARVYLKSLSENFRGLLENKRERLEVWDKCYFDPDEWKVDSRAPWQWRIRVWAGPDYLVNMLSHAKILSSLPEDAPEITEYNRIIDDVVNFNTQDLVEMEKLVAKEEHPGRAISIAKRAAQEAANRKREAEILAEPSDCIQLELSRLKERISRLEAEIETNA